MSEASQINFYTLVVAIIAAAIALLGNRLWVFIDRYNKNQRIKKIMYKNLSHLKSDLLRIRDKRNSPSGEPKERIIFNKTSFCEISGYGYLYTEFFLQHVNDIDVSKYPSCIEFFLHYRINIETINSRFGLMHEEMTETNGKVNSAVSRNGHLTYASVNALLERLEKAITEFS